MKIAMFTNTYSPHTGGVAHSVSSMVKEFRLRAHEVLVVAPEFDGQQNSEPGVIRVKAIRDFNQTGFSLALPPPPAVTRAVREFRPDVIHSHHPFVLGASAMRIGATLGVPIVMTYHTMYEWCTHYLPVDLREFGQIAISLARDYANECDHVVAPTASLRTLLLERGISVPISVIPTGVDIKDFQDGEGAAARQRLGIACDAAVVGHVGRLTAEKNLDFLASELAAALGATDRAVVLIVGDGPERTTMERLLRSRLPYERVRFAGQLEGKPLADAYHAMDVFAFASVRDTQGLVLAEAMACGLPVIALDAPGARDIVRSGENGILVGSREPGQFAAAIREILEADEEQFKRFSIAAYATAHQWSMKRTTDRYVHLYQTIQHSTSARRARTPGYVGGALRGIGNFTVMWAKRIQAGAKIVAGTNSPPRPLEPDFQHNVHSNK